MIPLTGLPPLGYRKKRPEPYGIQTALARMNLDSSPGAGLPCTVRRSRCAESRCSGCVRNVSKRYLFWSLGLAFERKADAPSYSKETKSEGSSGVWRGLGGLPSRRTVSPQLYRGGTNFRFAREQAKGLEEVLEKAAVA
jgi:hypothetical protein